MPRSEDTLASLLRERSLAGADHEQVDARIWRTFGERWCVLFTDMSGFSRRSARAGIIPFLALIHEMRALCGPIWIEHAGILMKDIADSQLVLFRDPGSGLRACIQVQHALAAYNEARDEADRIYLGCGLGFGDVLKLGDNDVYGVEVNLSAKLGEDLAGPFDIFLTPECVQAIGETSMAKFEPVKGGRLSGMKIPYYSARYDLGPRDPRKKAKSQRIRSR